MTDLFDDLYKILRKDLLPILVRYMKDPNNKISDNFTNFLNDPRILLNEIFEKFSKNKDNDFNEVIYRDTENIIDNDSSSDEEYEELLKRLICIEENMIKLKKILKDKN